MRLSRLQLLTSFAGAWVLASACAAGTDMTGDGLDGGVDTGTLDTGLFDVHLPDTSGGFDTSLLPDTHHAVDANDAGSGDGGDPETGSGDAATDASDAPVEGAPTEGGPTPEGGTDSAMPDTGIDAPFDVSPTCTFAFKGTLAAFDLSSQPGNEVSAAATSSASGLTVGVLGRAAAITAVTGTGSINGDGWSTGATADPARYYTFTVTPPSGCAISLTDLALDVRASSTGPSKGDVATSDDAFATHTASFAGTSTPNVALSVTSTSAVEVRVYGYGASSASGTFRIRNTMTLSGSLH